MFELLELILSIILDSSGLGSTNSLTELTPGKIEPLATSPSTGDAEGSAPGGSDRGSEGKSSASKPKPVDMDTSGKSDSEICKEMTDMVIEMQKKESLLHPVTTIEVVDDAGRKHVAFLAGKDTYVFGDKKANGCVSFPAPGPAPSKK